MQKIGVFYYLKFLGLTFFALFISCEKKQNYTLPPPSPNIKPVEIVITSIDVINCNFEDCINQDVDLKPDIYLKYNYLSIFGGTLAPDYFTSVNYNLQQTQLPIRYPINGVYSYGTPINIEVHDLDSGTPGSGAYNLLGATKFQIEFIQYTNLLESHLINDTSSVFYYSFDNKLAIKLNLIYK